MSACIIVHDIVGSKTGVGRGEERGNIILGPMISKDYNIIIIA